MNETNHRFAVAAARRERMRMRLIYTALQVAARKGPGGMSIDDVILAAEVSRGTFHRYFDSPGDLVREVGILLTNELISLAESVVCGYPDPVERTASGIRLVIALSARFPVIAGFLSRLAWADIHDSLLLLAFARRDIEEGLRQGRFADIPMQLALNIVVGATLSSIHTSLQPSTAGTFAEHATASALMALGVVREDAMRIASLPLSLPECRPDGLMAQVDSASSLTEIT